MGEGNVMQPLERPRSMGVFSGGSILVATLIGPTVVIVPQAMSTAGVIPSFIILVLLWALGSICASMFCEALAAIPDNAKYSRQVEFVGAVYYYLGPRTYKLAVSAFNLGFLLTIVLSVVQSTNVCDSLIADIMGETCGLRLNPPAIVCHKPPLMPNPHHCKKFHDNQTACLSDRALGCNWGNAWDYGVVVKKGHSTTGCFVDSRTMWGRGVPIVVTKGFLMVIVLCVPLSLGNLESNAMVQIVSCLGTIFIFVFWGISMYFRAEAEPKGYSFTENNIPWFGGGVGVANLIGTVLYSSGFAHYMPSILNESKKGLNVHKLIWYSSTCSLLLTLIVGYGGALAFGELFQTELRADLLEALTFTTRTPEPYRHWAQIGVWLFPFLVIVPGIPVACVMLKYNLRVEGPMFSEGGAVFWGVIFPFLVSLPFLSYHSLLNTAVAWLSVGVLSFVDMVIPLRVFMNYMQWKLNSRMHDRELLTCPHRQRRPSEHHLQKLGQSPFTVVEVTPPHPEDEELNHYDAETGAALQASPGRSSHSEDRTAVGMRRSSKEEIVDQEVREDGSSTPVKQVKSFSYGTPERGGGPPRDEAVPLFVAAEETYRDAEAPSEKTALLQARSGGTILARHTCPDTRETHVALPWAERYGIPLGKLPFVCRIMMSVFMLLMLITVTSMISALFPDTTTPVAREKAKVMKKLSR